MSTSSGCRIVATSVDFADLAMRVPLKFGTGVVESVVSATARVTVEGAGGARAEGLGQILLGELWSFPSECVDRRLRLQAMRRVSEQAAAWLAAERPEGHPLEIGWVLKQKTPELCREATEHLSLAEPMPLLSGLNSASPFDAAVHDACGKLRGRSTYDCYGPGESPDLSSFLGSGFVGRYISRFLRDRYHPEIRIQHLVGGSDKLRESEVGPDDPDDGLPVSLEKWIERDGVHSLKVKLSGHDVDADVARMIDVYAVATAALQRQPARRLWLSADSNEQTENVDACVAFLEKLRRDCPPAFEALRYLEQPTGRDLRVSHEDMTPAARIKPVMVDEAVAELDDLDLAYQLGWSGVALKTCKGHTATLLMIAKTVEAGRGITVQDLTNPAHSYIHSVGVAARVKNTVEVEANARQFIPSANDALAARFPRLFALRDGVIRTDEILPVGLGY